MLVVILYYENILRELRETLHDQCLDLETIGEEPNDVEDRAVRLGDVLDLICPEDCDDH